MIFTPYINSPVISRSPYSVDFAICMGKREQEHVNIRCPVAQEQRINPSHWGKKGD